MADLSDKVWRMLQGRKLRPAEREILRRTLQALEPERDPRELEASSTREVFLDHEAIVEEGEEGRDLFMVLLGKVDVLLGAKIVESLGPGEIFGEIGLLSGDPRNATVQASGRTIALRVPPSIIDEQLREALWEYAAERRFLSLPFTPIDAGVERLKWWLTARHARMGAGEYHAPAPWLFVYDGEVEVEGEVFRAPTLCGGGALRLESPARLALLPDP